MPELLRGARVVGPYTRPGRERRTVFSGLCTPRVLSCTRFPGSWTPPALSATRFSGSCTPRALSCTRFFRRRDSRTRAATQSAGTGPRPQLVQCQAQAESVPVSTFERGHFPPAGSCPHSVCQRSIPRIAPKPGRPEVVNTADRWGRHRRPWSDAQSLDGTSPSVGDAQPLSAGLRKLEASQCLLDLLIQFAGQLGVSVLTRFLSER